MGGVGEKPRSSASSLLAAPTSWKLGGGGDTAVTSSAALPPVPQPHFLFPFPNSFNVIPWRWRPWAPLHIQASKQVRPMQPPEVAMPKRPSCRH